MVLQGVQLIVPPMTGQQLLVAALLQNFAVGQHDDVVRVLDGGKAVATISMVPTVRIFSRES